MRVLGFMFFQFTIVRKLMLCNPQNDLVSLRFVFSELYRGESGFTGSIERFSTIKRHVNNVADY